MVDELHRRSHLHPDPTQVRTPGILFTCFCIYQAMLYGRHVGLPMWSLSIQWILPCYNALYYNKQAVANFTVHFVSPPAKHSAADPEAYPRPHNLAPAPALVGFPPVGFPPNWLPTQSASYPVSFRPFRRIASQLHACPKPEPR